MTKLERRIATAALPRRDAESDTTKHAWQSGNIESVVNANMHVRPYAQTMLAPHGVEEGRSAGMLCQLDG